MRVIVRRHIDMHAPGDELSPEDIKHYQRVGALQSMLDDGHLVLVDEPEPESESVPAEPAAPTVDLAGMTKAELYELAAELAGETGAKMPSKRLSKRALVALLKETRDG